MAAGHKTGFAEQDLPNAMKWNHFHRRVAPHAGAWIEIMRLRCTNSNVSVAPRAGAWIEMPPGAIVQIGITGRSPRGNVD